MIVPPAPWYLCSGGARAGAAAEYWAGPDLHPPCHRQTLLQERALRQVGGCPRTPQSISPTAALQPVLRPTRGRVMGCPRCVAERRRSQIIAGTSTPGQPRPRRCRVVRCRSLREETSASGCRAAALRHALAGEDSAANAALYVLLRAVDRFHQTYQRFPGVYDR
jgi:hypothetical protein